MRPGSKRIALGLFIAILSLGSITEPAQGAKAPKKPEPISDIRVFSNPIPSSYNNAQTAATGFLTTLGPSWGIDPGQFVFDSAVSISQDQTVVRFTQHYADSLFLGAIAALTIAADESLVSYTLKTGIAPAGIQSVDSTGAVQAAKSHFADSHQIATSGLKVGAVISAIADPTLQNYVQTSSWVWRIEVSSAESIGSALITVDAYSLRILDSQDQVLMLDSSPLVCNMQMMNSSSTKKVSKATYVATTSIKLKAKKSQQPLVGVKGKKLWVVTVVDGDDAVSSKITSVTVRKSQAVTLKSSYAYVPTNSTYTVYVATGAKKPSYSALKLYGTHSINSGALVISGAIPTGGSSFADVGVSANTFHTFINVSKPGIPICDYKNRGVKKNSPDAFAQLEKTNTYKFINEFRSYFSRYVDSKTDIGSEMYLGNVSPKLNYGKKTKCATDVETGYCTPRITAFTNACLMMYGTLSCPNFSNAAWTAWRSADCRSGLCNGIFIGRGFAVDDVIAHELTHGLTSALAFGAINSTSGAISEALSDVFGESYDQLTLVPGENSDPAWSIGEDLNTNSVHGAVRNMQGTYQGANPVIDSCWNNNAEMHANVGPVNRFAWLLVNGGNPEIAHQGCSQNPSFGLNPITPIGIDQTESIVLMNQLIWSAIPSMGTSTGGSTIDFIDFGVIVQATCDSLWGVTSPARCDSVHAALVATGMSAR